MPYDWHDDKGTQVLRAWPYRSLPRKGFVWFLAITAILLALPLTALLGSMLLWGLLPFMLVTITGIWWAINQSYRSGRTLEILRLSRNRISLTRSDPGQPDRQWNANPYWIRATIRPGPVENYLVLTGDHESGREIEFGLFLSTAERAELEASINHALTRIRNQIT